MPPFRDSALAASRLRMSPRVCVIEGIALLDPFRRAQLNCGIEGS